MDAFDCIAKKLDVRRFSNRAVPAEVRLWVLEGGEAKRQQRQPTALEIHPCTRPPSLRASAIRREESRGEERESPWVNWRFLERYGNPLHPKTL